MLGKPKNPIDVKTNIQKAQIHLQEALLLLRESRNEVSRPTKTGGRELSEAITCIETGCMWMNRSQFAETDYSPIVKLPEKE